MTTGLLGDTLTEAEQAYLDSGGENAEGLLGENGGTPDATADTSASPPADAKPDAVTETKSDAAAQVDPPAKAGDPDALADDALADAVADDPQRKPPERVSYRKFKKAEERAKASEREVAELREKFARGDERLRLLSEALQAPQKPEGQGEEDKAPDPEQDIFAFVRWQGRQIERLGNDLKAARGEIGQTRENIQARDDSDTLRDAYQRDAVAFAQETPDFAAAYQHMLNARGAMLARQGKSREQITEILKTEERGLVQDALSRGVSPAEMIYGIAQDFGYRKADPATTTEPKPDGGQAAQAKPAVNGNGKPSATEMLKTVQAGQAASKTLSGAGGTSPGLTAEALANMSEKEFEALLRSKPGQVEALLGRLH